MGHMRKLRNIDKSLTKEILTILPHIQNVTFTDDPVPIIYEQAYITVFDHWLTINEANNEITHRPNDIYNKQLHEFANNLFKDYVSYFVKFKGIKKEVINFKVVTSDKAAHELLQPTHHLASGQFRYILAIPELEIIYFEGCDYTHHVYYKSESKLSFVIELAKKYDLHVLK